MDWICAWLNGSWILFLDSAPYLIAGFSIAAILHQFLSDSLIRKAVGGPPFLAIFKASVVGTPIPLCSCGVVPVGLELRRQGIQNAPTMSFLIATPENGVDSISLSASIFGWQFTWVRVVFSLLVANFTALLVHFFGGSSPEFRTEAKPDCCHSKPSAEEEKKNGVTFIFNKFLPEIAHWMVFGFVFAGFLGVLIPEGWIETHINPEWNLVIAALIGVPMYVCASASTPIAWGLLSTGFSPGACLVFLLTGPATNAANIPLYMKEFGVRSTMLFYLGIFLSSIGCGYIVDRFLDFSDLWRNVELSHAHAAHYGVVDYAAAGLLAIAIVYALWVRYAKPHNHIHNH